MAHNLNAPNLSALGGRALTVHVPRTAGFDETSVPGVIEIRDVTGDQDGPAVVALLERQAAAASSLPHTIALDTATIARFLATPPGTPLEITL